MVDEVDVANAEVELATAKRYRARGNEMSDANAPGESVTNLGSQGLNVVEAPIEEGMNNPSLLRILYHAFDGRVVPVPDYMAPRRLAERFPEASWVPQKWWNKRVWFLEPQALGVEHHQLKCLLHEGQDDTVKGEVREAGFTPGRCSKSNIPNAYAVQKHMELKHKDEWRAILTLRDRHFMEESRADQRAQTDAFIKLAEALTKQGG